jgi:hypothetical protein
MIVELGHTRGMASEVKMLSPEEFASLFLVGNTPAASPPPVIPAAHSAKLIALGYMADIQGRLRMTTPGRIRIYAGQLAAQPVSSPIQISPLRISN